MSHDGLQGSAWHKFGHRPISAKTVCVEPKSSDCRDCQQQACGNTSIYADSKRSNEVLLQLVHLETDGLQSTRDQRWTSLVIAITDHL